MAANNKVAQLPGSKVSPELLLSNMLEDVKSGAVKAIYIGYVTEDGKFGAVYSAQTALDLLGHAQVAEARACKSFFT